MNPNAQNKLNASGRILQIFCKIAPLVILSLSDLPADFANSDTTTIRCKVLLKIVRKQCLFIIIP
ncbi:hypothetical protein COI_0225 [Mannheimia haemolytica serotype A2 str. OVINE]|nr:hypothetical protein COI_0225 [Mannheimia haemolytica serotype A2 str. OVINE]